jgi:ribosomal protein L37AE/L43A
MSLGKKLLKIFVNTKWEKNLLNNCSFCGSDQLEKISEKHIVCKNCGFGFGNTGKENPENMAKYVQQMATQLRLQRILFPTDTDKQAILRFSFHMHRIEKHPVTRDGFCEFCDRNWNTMSKKELKEQLGYNKEKWEMEN